MNTKELLLHEVSMLLANYNNLVKAREIAKDDWDKDILLSIASNLLVTIASIMGIITNMKN